MTNTPNYETFEVIRVQMPKPFSDFYVQIEKTNDAWKDGRIYHDMILRSEHVYRYFGSTPIHDITEAIDFALQEGREAILEWLESTSIYNKCLNCPYDNDEEE